MPANHERPTSDWEHSHQVSEGDNYRVEDFGVTMTVQTVKENGDVVADMVPDGNDDNPIKGQEYSEEEIRRALADSLWVRESDGLSHELATF